MAEVPENVGNVPLLSEEFLSKCINMFSVPSRGVETNSQLFPLKHLNIIDPLKENNNLRRSVNSAFKYGARKLGQILILPRERIADELVKFFANTLERHGSNRLTDVQNIYPTSDASGSDHVMPSACASMCSGNYLLAKLMNVGSINDKISGSIAASGSRYKMGCSFNILSSQIEPERKTNANRNAVSVYCQPDAKEFVMSGLPLKCKNDSSDYLPLSSNIGTSLTAKPRINKQNGRIENGNSSKSVLTDAIAADNMSFALKPYSKKNILAASNVVCKRELAGIFGDSESLKSLLDLSADYDGHFWSVLYGQCCHLFSVSTPIMPSPVSPHLQKENHWEILEQSIPLKQDLYSQRDSNGIWGPKFCFSKPPGAVCPALDSEDEKRRRTGTYTLNMKYRSDWERPSFWRGNCQAPSNHSQFQRYTNNSCSATVQQEMTLSQEGSHELSLEEYPALGPVKFGSFDTHRPYQSIWGLSATDGLSCPPERFESGFCSLEFQSTHMSEDNALPESSTPCTCGSTPSAMVSAAQSAKPVLEINEESDAGQSYHLKNEHDFPPLSV